MKNTFNQDHFLKKEIKCNSKLTCKTNILENLYVMIYHSSQNLKTPLGLHIRIRLTKRMTLKSFSARLTTFYKRKFGYIPLRVSVKEDDPRDDGIHYHISIIIDGKINTKKSIQHFLAELKSADFLSDYKVITPKNNPHGQLLASENGMDEYFKWMSYLSKTSTKNEGQQSTSCCKKVQSDVSTWKKGGKQPLTIHVQHQTPETPPEAILEQFIATPIHWHRSPPAPLSKSTTGACSGITW
ncbi:hypothetical protein [Pseudomonas putida]|uniref:hypothetical protein n=1 Tax=Pseudomonas putida TaxID=303 RepID=UPI001269447B|nr:hypothetical protein [Pseudomonas putida]